MITFAAEERTDRTRRHPSAYPTNEPSKTETYKRQNNDETNDAQIHDFRNMACGCSGHSPRGKADKHLGAKSQDLHGVCQRDHRDAAGAG